LDQCLQRRGKLPAEEVRHIARETLLGLQAAHAKGLIHRDLRPAKLWLEPPPPPPCEGWDRGESRVKILDFGLAPTRTPDARSTLPGDIVGTRAYTAPEQARGEPEDPRADLFTLGCVLYQACTGTRLFQGGDAVRTTSPIVGTHQQALLPDVPKDLSALILQLVQNDPARRPSSARAALALLEGHSRHWRLALAAGLAAVVVLGVLKILQILR
jgi:serine/threonine protein kinase